MSKVWVVLLGSLFVGCAPGYIKSADLEARDQGPSACAKSCEDLGMRMTALVLVGAKQPGCVCQPVTKGGLTAPPLSEGAGTAEEGAAAATAGYVVIAAAEAAEREADERRRQLQRQQKK